MGQESFPRCFPDGFPAIPTPGAPYRHSIRRVLIGVSRWDRPINNRGIKVLSWCGDRTLSPYRSGRVRTLPLDPHRIPTIAPHGVGRFRLRVRTLRPCACADRSCGSRYGIRVRTLQIDLKPKLNRLLALAKAKAKAKSHWSFKVKAKSGTATFHLIEAPGFEPCA